MKTNTLEILEKSALPTAQARAIFQAMESEIANRDERLATGEQVRSLELKLGEQMRSLEMRIGERMSALELKFEQLRTEVKTDIKGLETRFALWMIGMFVALAGLMHAFPGHG